MGDLFRRMALQAGTGLSWVWTGANSVMNLIGRSTLPEDTETAKSVLRQIVEYLVTLPWWVPALCAFALTGALVYWGRPRPHPIAQAGSSPLTTATPADVPRDQMKVIVGGEFRSETVPLDGHNYINCTFSDVMFNYEGGSYEMHNCKVIAPVRVQSNNQTILRGIGLMSSLYPGEKIEKTDGAGRKTIGLGVIVLPEGPPGSAAPPPPPQGTEPRTQP